MLAFFGGGYFYINYNIKTPLNKYGESYQFEVEKGEGLQGIAQNLEEARLIRENFFFIIYVWSSGKSKSLQAGKYILSPSMAVPDIVNIITAGKTESREIGVTIPEGFTIRQIEERLKIFNFQFFTSSEVEGSIFNSESYKIGNYEDRYDFLRDAPNYANLEGFLFPDTYRFDKEASAEDIIKKMLDNFDKKLAGDLREEIKRQNKTIFNVVIMASMIEREVIKEEDRELVSGILWKRLRIGMPLQVDSTINYITGKNEAGVSLVDTKIDSTYNTYLYKGFPSGPISNPGIDAIKAAIFPKESDFWYYLSTPKGETIFSRTLEEHNLAKAKYLR